MRERERYAPPCWATPPACRPSYRVAARVRLRPLGRRCQDEVHPRKRHWRRYREWDRISCTRWGVTASTACCSKHGAHEACIVCRTQTNLDVDELGAPPPTQCLNECMGSWYCEYARGELGGELCCPCHRCACEPLLSACPWGAG
jgi:hypothetical protein